MLRIENVTPDDLSSLEELTRAAVESIAYLTHEQRRELLLHIFDNYKTCTGVDTEHLFLKAVLDNQVVGLIWVKQFRNLAELFVSVLRHRHGVGRCLLHAAINSRCPISPKGLLRVNSSAAAF